MTPALGAAEGHDKNYGRFLVATGPYEFEGADTMDFSLPPADQTEAPGYVPGRSIVLVRNPGWDAATDDLRPAYPDRIEVSIGGNNDDLYNKVKSNDLDFVVDGAVPPETIRDYTTDPDLQNKINVYASDALRYVSFNFLTPPFDDIHVRKAFNWALDKDGMRQLRGGADHRRDRRAHHGEQPREQPPRDYDPYATPNAAGDIEKAKAEMAQSKYDTNQDGVCDAPECSAILAVTDREDPYPKQAALIAPIMEQIGLTFDVKALERRHDVHQVQRPELAGRHLSRPRVGQGLPGRLHVRRSVVRLEFALAELLQLHGPRRHSGSDQGVGLHGRDVRRRASTTRSPHVARSRETPCSSAGRTSTRSLMEDVVPYAPYLFDNNVDITSDNVINYSFDQFAGLAAFDQLAVANKG